MRRTAIATAIFLAVTPANAETLRDLLALTPSCAPTDDGRATAMRIIKMARGLLGLEDDGADTSLPDRALTVEEVRLVRQAVLDCERRLSAN